MSEVQCVQQANAILGEGPTWDASSGVLYWVDIKRPAIFRWHPTLGQTGHWPLKRPVGFASPAQSGRMVFADSEGLGFSISPPEISNVSAILRRIFQEIVSTMAK